MTKSKLLKARRLYKTMVITPTGRKFRRVFCLRCLDENKIEWKGYIFKSHYEPNLSIMLCDKCGAPGLNLNDKKLPVLHNPTKGELKRQIRKRWKDVNLK